jgi:hypothetical protein
VRRVRRVCRAGAVPGGRQGGAARRVRPRSGRVLPDHHPAGVQLDAQAPPARRRQLALPLGRVRVASTRPVTRST